MAWRSKGSLCDASRFPMGLSGSREGGARIGAHSDILAPLGRLLMPFGRPLDFEGVQKSSFMDMQANKMKKMWS